VSTASDSVRDERSAGGNDRGRRQSPSWTCCASERVRDGVSVPVRRAPQAEGDQREGEEQLGKTQEVVAGRPLGLRSSIQQANGVVNG